MKAKMQFEEPERFWSKVEVGEADECWEWLACKFHDGCGAFQIHHKAWRAPRVTWILTFGPIPEGLCVCHHCDNPSCCNPYHLFLGTSTDNMADAARKGRMSKNRPKLTKDDVLEIRELFAAGELTQYELADEFGVSRSAISNITRRKRWKHI